jgi:1-deoxy-D-xylulose-5-phosphate reductoisomerase
MKRLAILGSTGSIGKKTLEIVDDFPDNFQVTALSTFSNVQLLHDQIVKFKPKNANIVNKTEKDQTLTILGDSQVNLTFGISGMVELVKEGGFDLLVLATVGSSGLMPCLQAIEQGIDIALANKEVLVMAGKTVMSLARAKEVRILPIDSEHSAISQCLEGKSISDVSKIILTASGGPFRELDVNDLESVTLDDTLAHPTWDMGRKITVDSATMLNKGFEVIEAQHLFDIDISKIEVVIHPQSIIHSLVEFKDGTIIAQMSVTDMYLPILAALSYPERFENKLPKLNLTHLGHLNFEKPDFDKFPCLKYAYEAAEVGGTAPVVLNAANEITVNSFLEGNIKFIQISKIVRTVLDEHNADCNPTLDKIRQADRWARSRTAEVIGKYKCQ